MPGRVILDVVPVCSTPPLLPWMGAHYLAQGQAVEAGEASCCMGRWHVMGESHPGVVADQYPDFTRDVMQHLALREEGYPFFDTVLSAVTGKPVGELDRKPDWSSYAFSNFVQDILIDGNRRPNEAQWKRGGDFFLSQLAVTRPRQLLAVGKMQWDNIPPRGGIGLPSFDVKPEWGVVDDAWLYAYEVAGQTHFTIAVWVYHPSSRGRLDIEAAQNKIRSVTMMSCNILSQVEYDGSNWTLELW